MKFSYPVLFALCLIAAEARAEGDALDVTMQIVEMENSMPGAVTQTIQLPPKVAEPSKERKAVGNETAGQARSDVRARGRAVGRSVAEEAKARPRGPRKRLLPN